MSKHSAIVGGSTAGRLLNCPASLAAIRALPPSADKPSEYAEEGTAMHAVMDALMRARMGGADAVAPADYVGQVFHDRPLTHEHLDSMIYPALEHLATLEEEYDSAARFQPVGVEQRVTFPGVPGAFGTTDLLLSNGKYMLLVDWKFGQGIPIKAVYADPAGDLVNPQLMFYLAASLNTVPKLFQKHQFVVAIIQPRTEERLTHTAVSRGRPKAPATRAPTPARVSCAKEIWPL